MDPATNDTDGDGINDSYEVTTLGSNALEQDTDGDRLPDGRELELGADPTREDTDGDTYSDWKEVERYNSSPASPDTDADGIADNDDPSHGTDRLNPDSDGDDLNDGAELKYGTEIHEQDTDGDGYTDGREVFLGLSPTKPFEIGENDRDEDGLSDRNERRIGTDLDNADTDDDQISDGDEVYGQSGIGLMPVTAEERHPAFDYIHNPGPGNRDYNLDLKINPYPGAHPLHADMYVHFLSPETEPRLSAEHRQNLTTFWANRSIENPDGSTGVRVHTRETIIPENWAGANGCMVTQSSAWAVSNQTYITDPYFTVMRKDNDVSVYDMTIGYSDDPAVVWVDSDAGARVTVHELIHSIVGALDGPSAEELAEEDPHHMTRGIMSPLVDSWYVPDSLEAELRTEYPNHRRSWCYPLRTTMTLSPPTRKRRTPRR